MASAKAEAKSAALEKLRARVPAGSTIYGIVREISRSGMSRTIDFYAFTGSPNDRLDHRSVWLSPLIRDIYGARMAKADRGLVIHGCGMDMIMHVATYVSGEAHGKESAYPYASL